jgi:glycosyltransferase involved in cell wall biosynthesis
LADFLVEKEGIKKEKIAVIYNGIEIEEIKNTKKEFFDQKEKIRREMRLTLGHKIFLNIARINTQKNHRLMIEAFYDLCKKRGDCRLVIIGDGSLKNNIEKQIKELGLENKVLLLGERKDIYKFYSISDFFILTSMREGFCISAMNGLAFGLPLISTKVAGVSEYLKDGKNGFFADSDPKDISEKMDTMANLPHEELSKMKKNSEETAEEFDIKKYGEAYQKLFLACVGRA